MATQADRIAAATIELGPKDTLVKSWTNCNMNCFADHGMNS
jgi:hypothetical protein